MQTLKDISPVLEAKCVLLKNDTSKMICDMEVLGVSDKNNFSDIDGCMVTMIFPKN